MRDYAKLSPTFWTGDTGKALRKRGSEAVVVALYLVSSPGSNMNGLYYQPILFMAHETGLGLEGAMKGLRHCIECHFCAYDEESEMVWIYEMAAWQIADQLKASDNRCAGIQKDYDSLPNNPFLGDFFDRYYEAFHLSNRRSYIDPCKPLPSQEQEQEQEQDKNNPPLPPSGGKKRTEAISFKAFIANCKAKGEAPISSYKPVFDFSQSVGLSSEFVQLAWFEFGRQMGEGGVSETKRQADWRKTFRNYVEKNYLKLWYMTAEGGFELTTAGKTAKLANAERLAA